MKTARWWAGLVCGLCVAAGNARAADWHVATNGNDAADGASWATAKLTIQAAIDVAASNDTVWVSNGVYATGGRLLSGLTNRVVVDKPLTVRSVNGADATIIQGAWDSSSSNGLGSAAVRCAYVGDNAVLSGFTLTNGGTWPPRPMSVVASGGGVYCTDYGLVTECTLIGNVASFGGGAFGGTLNNCRLIGNWAYYEGGGFYQGTMNNCTVVGNSAGSSGGGTGNCNLNNGIVYGNTAPAAPNFTNSTVNHSCTMPDPGGTGNITNDPRFVDGGAAGNYWLNAMSPCIDAGDNDDVQGTTDLNGNPRIIFDRVDMGAYEYPSKMWYVASDGSDGAAGTNWATAKQTIQTAIDETRSGEMVWVSNGTYATGGRTTGGWALTNRVAIDRAMEVQSVNGPEATFIQGAWDPAAGNGLGDAAVRCAYVGSNAVLSGFTLTNGATRAGGEYYEQAGGGVYCEDSGALNNCILAGNSAGDGGGVIGGTLNQCLIVGNFALGYGGGGFWVNLNNCTVVNNSAGIQGGGLHSAQAVSNGMILLPANNSIVYGNAAPSGANYALYPFVNSCTTPDSGGIGCTTNDPQFVDAAAGDYRLQTASPCIDAGDNGYVSGTTDFDGNPRIAYGTVDMGAYEAQLTGLGVWFNAITNGLTNDTDCAAGDGVPNLLKYATGSSPRISDDMMLLDRASNNGVPTLVFNRNPNATDVALVIQGADAMSNGAAWRGVATNLNGSWGGAANVDESGTGNPVVCTVEDPVLLRTNRFLRLKVTRP